MEKFQNFKAFWKSEISPWKQFWKLTHYITSLPLTPREGAKHPPSWITMTPWIGRLDGSRGPLGLSEVHYLLWMPSGDPELWNTSSLPLSFIDMPLPSSWHRAWMIWLVLWLSPYPTFPGKSELVLSLIWGWFKR